MKYLADRLRPTFDTSPFRERTDVFERCRFKTQTEARSAVFAFIEGFYNPRRRHSSIGYLSPIDYEHRHHAATVDRDAHQPAAGLAAVKDKPFGRPQP